MNNNLGLWNNVKDQYGNNSLSEHKPKLVSSFCKQNEHYFEPLSPTSRQLRCKKCNMESYYILGKQQLVDGKVINS